VIDEQVEAGQSSITNFPENAAWRQPRVITTTSINVMRQEGFRLKRRQLRHRFGNEVV
jgi:hypothetical protein